MSSLGSPSPFFLAGKKAYAVDRSLRLNDGDSAYLSRTPSSTSNRKTWTFSAWVKRSNITTGAFQTLFAANNSSNYGLYGTYIWFTTTDTLAISINSGIYYLQTNAKFRDVSAWYHVVINIDTTQATSSNRMKIYVNGVQETSFATTTYPVQNLDSSVNLNQQHTIGGRRYTSIDNYFDGYMAEVNFIDGFQYDPSYFGETDPITGQWNPKKYVGSYGTNGFYLNFSDNSGTTATTLGKDSSVNGNNFTPNNLSVTAGVGNDSVTDTPSNNFATLNPLSLTGAGGTFSNGNLDFTADSNYATRTGNISLKTGKWYWEVIITNIGTDAHGIVQGTYPNGNIYPGYDPNGNVKGIGWYHASGGLLYGSVPDGGTNGGTIPAGDAALSAYTTNDVLGFASDIANGTLAFYKNGTLEYTLTGIGSHDWFPAVCGYGTSSTKTINFGQLKATSTTYADANGHGSFKYSVPSGFLAMCTANFPNPVIKLPNKHFDTKLYTGNGSTGQTITYDFGPDFVWMKNRSTTNNHAVVNTVIGRAKGLYPDSSSAEFNSSAGRDVSAFTSNGFTVGEPEQASSTNNNGSNIVAWAWNGGEAPNITYRVVVSNAGGSGNKYRFRNSANDATFNADAVTLNLEEGGTYIFNMDDATNASHPFMIGTTANDNTTAFGSGIVYKLDGVVKTFAQYHAGFAAATTRRLEFTIPVSTNNLFYFCYSHSGMGGAVNTNSTTGSTNFDGIDSTDTDVLAVVKANTTAGFSVVTWTIPHSNDYHIGHGLGVKPDLIITKDRDVGYNWWTFTDVFDGSNDYLALNSSGQANDAEGFNVYPPTSQKFEEHSSFNGSSGNMVAFCFSSVSGYSKVGTYFGNGSTDGVFIYTGFRPAWILVKRSVGDGNGWTIVDNKRDPHNPMTKQLYPNLSYADSNYDGIDFCSNGFKMRQTNAWVNGATRYLYVAFAESPFKYARAR